MTSIAGREEQEEPSSRTSNTGVWPLRGACLWRPAPDVTSCNSADVSANLTHHQSQGNVPAAPSEHLAAPSQLAGLIFLRFDSLTLYFFLGADLQPPNTRQRYISSARFPRRPAEL